MNIAFIFVSHDLHVVRHISDRIAVLQQGRIIETSTPKELFENPKEEYTQVLIKEQTVLFKSSKT